MKKNGKISESKKVNTERGTQVHLERMHADIQRIAEVQSSTVAQIAEIKADMPTKSEVNTISMAVMQISGDMKALKNMVDENLSNHEARITKLEEKVLI